MYDLELHPISIHVTINLEGSCISTLCIYGTSNCGTKYDKEIRGCFIKRSITRLKMGVNKSYRLGPKNLKTNC